MIYAWNNLLCIKGLEDDSFGKLHVDEVTVLELSRCI